MKVKGRDILIDALREIGVVGPREAGTADDLQIAKKAAGNLLEGWTTDRLFIRGITITDYPLISGQGQYTIGPGGDFNQVYPEDIERWSAHQSPGGQPFEIPRGRPATIQRWQAIRLKALTVNGPVRQLYFDRSVDANGRGNIYIWPIPTTAQTITLYQWLGQFTTIDPDASYDLPTGYSRAIQKNVALECVPSYGVGAVVTPLLERQAASALADIKRANFQVREAPIGDEYLIGNKSTGATDDFISGYD